MHFIFSSSSLSEPKQCCIDAYRTVYSPSGSTFYSYRRIFGTGVVWVDSGVSRLFLHPPGAGADLYKTHQIGVGEFFLISIVLNLSIIKIQSDCVFCRVCCVFGGSDWRAFKQIHIQNLFTKLIAAGFVDVWKNRAKKKKKTASTKLLVWIDYK